MGQLLDIKRQAIDDENQRFLTIGDAEALHDLRVAMRRLHSIFIAFSPAFNAKCTFPNELRRLQKQTNHARDLEVLLALLKNRKLQLPWLEQQWQRELDVEYARLRHTLPKAWQAISPALNDTPALLGGNHLGQRLGDLGAKLLQKKTKQLQKHRKAVCRKWTDKSAHALRIEGKQTRYLLEPFIDGIPFTETAVAMLKEFQELLGEYHDIVVLRDKLKLLQQLAIPEHFRQLQTARKQLKRERILLRKRFLRKFCDNKGALLERILRKAVKGLAEN